MGSFFEHLALSGFVGALLHLALINGFGIEISISQTIVGLGVVLFSGVLPDIDHRQAKIHKMTRSFVSIVFGAGISFFILEGIVAVFLGSLVGTMIVYFLFGLIPFKHRGKTHTVTFGVIVSGLIGGLTFVVFGSFLPAIFSFVGHFSHLVLDRCLKG